MDDQVGGIYLHASGNSTTNPVINSEENELNPEVISDRIPLNAIKEISPFPELTPTQNQIQSVAANAEDSLNQIHNGRELEDGNPQDSRSLESIQSEYGSQWTASASIEPAEKANPSHLQLGGFDQDSPESHSNFLESDVSTALEALVSDDTPLELGEQEKPLVEHLDSSKPNLISENGNSCFTGSQLNTTSSESIIGETVVNRELSVERVLARGNANTDKLKLISVDNLHNNPGSHQGHVHSTYVEARTLAKRPAIAVSGGSNMEENIEMREPSVDKALITENESADQLKLISVHNHNSNPLSNNDCEQSAYADGKTQSEITISDTSIVGEILENRRDIPGEHVQETPDDIEDHNNRGQLEANKTDASVPHSGSSNIEQGKRSMQANYQTPFDPTSKRSLKQRQKIHNIVDRLRTGHHPDGSAVVPSQSNPFGSQIVTNESISKIVSMLQQNTTQNSVKAVDPGNKSVVYKPRSDTQDGVTKISIGQLLQKTSLTRQMQPNMELSTHSQVTNRMALSSPESSGGSVSRIHADSNTRRGEFPQVMIQDVFSQSTGKRLTQRSQPFPNPYPNTSTIGVNQQGSTVGSPITTTGTTMAVQHGKTDTANKTEEVQSQHYITQNIQLTNQQLANHQIQPDGSLAHQHHPKANISHYDRSNHGLIRPYGQWTYNNMHNPISNLQHFVNQPNPSHRQQIAMPIKQQQNQPVVDLSSVQYGSSNSPMGLHGIAADQPSENDQPLPRLQPVNTGQGVSPVVTAIRGTGYTAPRYGSSYAPNAMGTGPYIRHPQQGRPQQMIRHNVGNPIQANLVYQSGPTNALRGAGDSPTANVAHKAMNYTVNSGREMLSPDRIASFGPNQRQSTPQNIQNRHLPIPLPNFGGFMSTQGLEGPAFDSLSGYLVVPIKNLKDSACQTDESALKDNEGHIFPRKVSVGTQAQSRTFLCGSCLNEADIENGSHEKAVNDQDLICKLCDTDFSSVSKLQNHKYKVHNVRLPFRCGECAIRFEDYASVVKHLASHNDDTTCRTCGKSFQSKEICERHERVHQSPLNTCQFCSKQFKNSTLMRKHIEEVHNIGIDTLDSNTDEVNNNVDGQSDEEFSSDRNDNNVLLTQNVKPSDGRERLASQDSTSDLGDHYCHFCNAHFATDKYLLNHYLEYHRKGYGFQCPVCPRYVHLWSRLKKHIKDHGLFGGTIDGEQDPESIPPSPSTSTNSTSGQDVISASKTNLLKGAKSLLQKTKDGRWECLKCGESFYSEVRVKNHLGSAHEQRLYHCNICNLLFPHSTHLYWHMRDHKRKGDISEIPAKFVSLTQSITSEATFKCKHCPEIFQVEKHLSNHLGQKHGYKLFSCQICGDKFNYSSRLVMHMKYHSCKQKTSSVNLRQLTRSRVFNPISNGGKSENVSDSDMIESDTDITADEDVSATMVDTSIDDTSMVDADMIDGSVVVHKNLSDNTGQTANAYQNGFVYLCGFCNEGFSEESAFRTHMLGHQRHKRYSKCRICGEQFTSIEDAKSHMELHKDTVGEDIGANIVNLESENLDGQTDSYGDNLWTSAFVDEETESEKINNMSDTSVPVFDGNSQKSDSQPARLTVSDGENVGIKCPICRRVFKTKPSRRIHMKAVHHVSGMRHFGKIRQKIHGRVLNCPICEKGFRNETGTRQHMQNVHRLSLEQIRGAIRGTRNYTKVRQPYSNSTAISNIDSPGNPPGLQKLIITKAKGQNTLVVSTASETHQSKQQDDNPNPPEFSPPHIDSPNTIQPNGSTDTPDFQCPHCEKVSFAARGIRSHMTRIHYMLPKITNIWSLCEICNRSYFDPEHLNAHRETFHKMKEEFMCPSCIATYPRFSGIYTHIRRKHPHVKWKMRAMWHRCCHCGKTFYDKQRHDDHVKSGHATVEKVARVVKPSPTKAPITPGEASSPGRGKIGSFHCPSCDKVVVTIKGMQIHIHKRHPDVEIRKWPLWKFCDVCDDFFFDAGRLASHMKSEHANEKRGDKKKLVTKKQLSDEEEKDEAVQPADNVTDFVGFQCPECCEFYPKFMGVDAHLRQTHNILFRKRKPSWSFCRICSKYYYTEDALKIHEAEEHGDQPENTTTGQDTTANDADVSGEITIDLPDQETSGFQCPKCEVVIPTIKGMQVHMFRGHSRLKRKQWQEWLNCSHCNLAFYDSKALYQHLSQRHGTLAETSMQQLEQVSVIENTDSNPEDKYSGGFRCPSCPHICPKYAGIDSHMRIKHSFKIVHGTKFWHSCHKCSLHFYSEESVNNHLATAHKQDGDEGEVKEDFLDPSKVSDTLSTRLRPTRPFNTSTPKTRAMEGEDEVSLGVKGSTRNFKDNSITQGESVTPWKVKDRGAFECPYCFGTYHKILGVDAHIRQRHGSSKRKSFHGWFPCEKCGRLLSDEQHRDEHMQRHLVATQDALADTESDITLNEFGDTSSEKLFQVDMGFVRRGSFNCPCCELSTNYKGIGVHLAKRHRTAPRKSSQLWTPCPHCNIFVYDDDRLREHLSIAHPEIEKKTESADFDVNIPEKELDYVDIDGTEPFETESVGMKFHCPGCDKVSSLRRGLSLHIYHQHRTIATKSTSAWKQCEQCSSYFYNESYLDAHFKEKHSDSTKSSENEGTSSIVPNIALDKDITKIMELERNTDEGSASRPVSNDRSDTLANNASSETGKTVLRSDITDEELPSTEIETNKSDLLDFQKGSAVPQDDYAYPASKKRKANDEDKEGRIMKVSRLDLDVHERVS